MRLLGGVLHGAEGPPGLGGHIEGARGVPAARRKEGVGSGSSFGISESDRDRDRAKKKWERAYARRSMSGAQFFSAMRPRSLRLALSTALR